MSWTGDWPDEARADEESGGAATATAEKPPTLTTEIWAGARASDRDEWREGQLGVQIEHAFLQASLEKRMGEIEELVFAVVTNLSRLMQ